MSTKYNAIHFDMDGVLADTEPFHVRAEQQTCHDFGFGIDSGQWGGFKGRTAEAIFSHLIRTYGNPLVHNVDDLIAHKTDIFIDLLADGLTPIDGSLEFLEWARSGHKNISLVTSSNKRVQRFITEAFGITGMFDAIVTGDEIKHGKPAPEPYLTALGKLGIGGEESLVIEDSTSGIISGLKAGCDVLAITTSHSPEELREVNPTFIAETYPLARLALEV